MYLSLLINGCHTVSCVHEKLAGQRAAGAIKDEEILEDIRTIEQVQLISSNCHHQASRENVAAVVASLKTCTKHNDLHQGRRIHAHLSTMDLLSTNIYVGTALVNMYAKCGAILKAQELFDELLVRDVVAWCALIAGYSHLGHGPEALNCFEWMQQEGISPNEVAFTCVLRACANVGALDKGTKIHVEIARQGFLENNVVLGNAVVDMYAKCGALRKAKEVFERLLVHDVVSWNVLIGGYTEHGNDSEALSCFQQMQCEGLSPDAITFTCILGACTSVQAIDIAQEIHAAVVRQGLFGGDTFIGNALVDMYAKGRRLAKAQEVFEELPVQTIVSWSALIAGYSQYGQSYSALDCFEQMQYQGFFPDAAIFTCILKCCGSIRAAYKGEEIHAEVVKHGLLEKNAIISNALVDMYGKCGAPEKAQEVFDELSIHDIVSWNALISAHVHSGDGHEALNRFEKMREQGPSPNDVTFTCICKVCGRSGTFDYCDEIHADIVRHGVLDNSTVLGSALVDMYGSCGSIRKAQQIFDGLLVQNVVSWNALITSYAQYGSVESTFNLFSRMIRGSIGVDPVTFTVLLNACSHTGLVEEGQKFLEFMSSSYGLVPTLEHYVCMVDLFGRTELFDDAMGVIKSAKYFNSWDNLQLWSTVLGTCLQWGKVNLGRLAFENIIQLDEEDAAAYICMTNIHAAACMKATGNRVEATVV